MLETVLAAVLRDIAGNRAVRSCGPQEFQFACFALCGRFEEACRYMLFFYRFIRKDGSRFSRSFICFLISARSLTATPTWSTHNTLNAIIIPPLNYLNIFPTIRINDCERIIFSFIDLFYVVSKFTRLYDIFHNMTGNAAGSSLPSQCGRVHVCVLPASRILQDIYDGN